MSIVIKGMKMPKNCLNCDFSDTDGDCSCRSKEPYECEFAMKERPDWCPIIAELPEKHGRLIDGDALRSSFRESIDECHKWAEECDRDTLMYARISQSMGTFVEASLRTKAQPTILEAEGEE